jgi:hypothetical protein
MVNKRLPGAMGLRRGARKALHDAGKDNGLAAT